MDAMHIPDRQLLVAPLNIIQSLDKQEKCLSVNIFVMSSSNLTFKKRDLKLRDLIRA